jgi:hypothetical protein
LNERNDSDNNKPTKSAFGQAAAATNKKARRPKATGLAPELRTWEAKMAIKLTQQEINYLRELTIGRKTMTGLKDRSGLKRLVDARYITEDSANVQMTVYSITELGRKALESSIEP